MLNDKLKDYLHLHFLVFIAGFTAVIGALISIEAISLVWYRMLIALVVMSLYLVVFKVNIQVSKKELTKFSLAGIIIALHWITFFEAIKTANISIALAAFSTGSFFVSFIEPLIFKRKPSWYEILFGIIIIIGVSIITKNEFHHFKALLIGVLSAVFSSFFAVLNGKFLETHKASVISFYEFIAGVLFISVYLLISDNGFSKAFFSIPLNDLLWLLILGTICTAYTFMASVYIMKTITPYTVVLTYNLEPVYGILLALIIFPEKEVMSTNFYLGAGIILITVLLNGIIKNIKNLKKKRTLSPFDN
ncbi:DMT family transporter [Mangrovimonas spongiae]|uniref:DMT family transporter n=1 Tax=Mangrovimonas spongiae TaxID=2494697 RepID=A0A3R9NQI5_9FLAO|nr:DMT family transporter [Mangrovimonas spongiae]RSK39371.1 DMT family transporter [Mangrovimonas spongiae]